MKTWKFSQIPLNKLHGHLRIQDNYCNIIFFSIQDTEESDSERVSAAMMGRKKKNPEAGKFSEYEIALLYNQFKAILPNENVNKKQLGLMLRQVGQSHLGV